jgi:hypothetical protein
MSREFRSEHCGKESKNVGHADTRKYAPVV